MKALALVIVLFAALPATAGDIDSAKWLSGCWAGSDGDRAFEERWMEPRADAMVGVGRSFRRERMTDVELMIIRARDGRLSYEAFPVGQAPSTFPAKAVTDESLAFEDLAHDFPQRIIYRRIDASSMVARIEGVVNGKEKAREFPMKRVPCN